MWKARRAFLSASTAKGGWGKIWAHCSKEEGTWWQRTKNNLRYRKPFLSQCLLARFTFRNLSFPGYQWEGLEKRGFTLGREGPSWGTSKQTKYIQVHGIWQDISISAEGAGQCHCEATVDNLWKVMEIERGSWWWEKSNYQFCLSEGQEGLGNYRSVRLTSVLKMKVMQQIIPETISKYRKMIWSS